MRFIDFGHIQRIARREQLDALREALGEVQRIDEDAHRRKFIDDHASACSALRHALWILGGCKCWYSEAPLEADSGEVEHYRPKKQVWGATPPHGGYWWRAFDLTNLRLAHPLVNKRRQDYSTERMAGKGCYFPLRQEEHRARDRASEAGEEPVLLDPVIAADCRLLCFDPSSGAPVPRFTREQDEWLHRRALDSIRYYHLDEGTWNYKRFELMCEVGILCDDILKAANNEEWDRFEEMLDELEHHMSYFAEFSSAAVQAVREKGLLELLRPLPGAGRSALRESAQQYREILPPEGDTEPQ